MGDSLLNGINEKGLSRRHKLRSLINLEQSGKEFWMKLIDDVNLFKSTPEHLVIHVRTNDLTNGINLLNNGKKIVKKINENLPKTCITFSSIINRKDRKDIDKKLTDTNQRFKSYCRQKNINYIENANIDENCLGVKKLHLSRKGNSCFGKNLLKYLSNV